VNRQAINDFLGGGLGPIPLGSPAGGGLLAFPAESFISPLLDLTVPTLGIELVPARPGYFAVPSGNAIILVEQAAGTQTSPPTTRAGSDPGHTNSIPSASTQPTSGAINGLIAAGALPGFTIGPVSTANTAGVQQLANTPIILDIVTGAQGTGGYILKAKIEIRVFWVAVS